MHIVVVFLMLFSKGLHNVFTKLLVNISKIDMEENCCIWTLSSSPFPFYLDFCPNKMPTATRTIMATSNWFNCF